MTMSPASSSKRTLSAISKRWQELNSGDLSIFRTVAVAMAKSLVQSVALWAAMAVFTSILTLGAMIQTYSWILFDFSFLHASVAMFLLTTFLFLLAVTIRLTTKGSSSTSSQPALK